jgi:oligosaccharide repeat unit polymerase
MRSKLITNPYIVFSIGFLLVTVFYTFHWSYLYPHLSFPLFLFIIATTLLSVFIGILLHKTNYFSYKNVSYSPRLLWIITIIILFSYLIECAYMHVIPLLAILNGTDYDYTSFGIPTFHVILVTFSSFWTVFVFHNFVSQKKKHLLLCFVLSLFPAILIFNRAMLLLNLGSSFFVLFMSAKYLRKLLVRVTIIVIGILFLFGVAGNIRVTGGQSINNIILNWGQATDEFRESVIPKEFFWAYLYITSPLANVQETINHHHITSFSFQKFGAFINRSFLPDFIWKRNTYFLHPIEHVNQISPSFTVGTVYGTSFAYFGWWGILLMYFYILFFNLFLILTLSKQSPFFVTGIAILDCIMLFNIFDNMFSFSGLSMQLFYPVFFGFFSNVRFFPKMNHEK